jgi:calcineurin-like phosphoesterase family protein
MTDTFFCSDLHLGHSNILQYELEHRVFPNIDSHDDEIIKRWNNKVGAEDAVWILGDLVINKKNLEKVGSLNGRKFLVLGNHDNFNQEYFVKLLTVVDRLFGCVEKHFGEIKTIMTHIPVHTSQLDYRYDFNLHGHLHSKKVKDNYGNEDKRYVNLSIENWNLEPVSFGELKINIDNRYKMMDS